MTYYFLWGKVGDLRGNDIGTGSRCSLRSFLEGKTILSYICLPFHSPTQASQLTGTSSYYRFRCHYPLITYLTLNTMENIYRMCAIIIRGLNIYYSILEGNFFVFN